MFEFRIKTEKNLKPQALLITLPYLKFIPDDKNLGFTFKSLCNIGQTALLAETECKGLTLCHSPLDFYNLFLLVKNLLPNSEWELLDELNNS